MRSCALLLANYIVYRSKRCEVVSTPKPFGAKSIGRARPNRPETNDYSRRLVVARSHLPKGGGVAQYTLPVQAAGAMPRRPQRPWKRLDTARRLNVRSFWRASGRSLANHRRGSWCRAFGGCLGVALGEDVGEGLGVGSLKDLASDSLWDLASGSPKDLASDSLKDLASDLPKHLASALVILRNWRRRADRRARVSARGRPRLRSCRRHLPRRGNSRRRRAPRLAGLHPKHYWQRSP